MQWLSPWAWAGLVMLAVPVVVHLFSRRPPRVVPFPSLRFVQATTPRPTSRSRIGDILLLLVRLTMIVVAVAALAQPLWHGAGRRTVGGTVSTAVIVDTTADARVHAADEEDRSRTAVRETTNAPDTLHLHVSAAALRSAIHQAVGWLRTQPAPRALVVRSSFPHSAVDSLTFASLPADVTLTLDVPPLSPVTAASPVPPPIAVLRDTIDWVTGLDARQADAVAAAVHARAGAVVRWSRADDLGGRPAGDTSPLQYSAPRTRPVLYTAHAPAAATYDSIAGGPALAASASATARLLTVARDQALRDLVALQIADADRAGNDASETSSTFPLLFDARGAHAMMGGVRDGQPILVSRVPERPTVAIAALLALSDNPAIRIARRLDGLDTTRRDTSTLRRWQTLPSARPIGLGASADVHGVATHARWLWLGVLLLMGAEWALRRSLERRS